MELNRTTTNKAGTLHQAGSSGDAVSIARTFGKQFDMTWASQSPEALAKRFTPDGKFITPFGQSATGHVALKELYAALLGGPLKGTQHKITVVDAREIRPGVAVVDVSVDISNIKAPNGAAVPDAKFAGVYVLALSGQNWLLSDARVYLPPAS